MTTTPIKGKSAAKQPPYLSLASKHGKSQRVQPNLTASADPAKKRALNPSGHGMLNHRGKQCALLRGPSGEATNLGRLHVA
jgi:hypothetical protein